MTDTTGHAEQIRFIAEYIQKRWIDWDREQRAKDGMTTDRDSAIMSLPGIDDLLPVPVWPSHGQFGNWVKALSEAADALAAVEAEAHRRETRAMMQAQGWRARAERAESALAQARKDAFEEAAKVAEDWRDDACLPKPSTEIAAVIRALSTKGETR